MSHRELSKVEVQTIYKFFASRAVEVFNEHGRFAPQLIVVMVLSDDDSTTTVGDALFIDSQLVDRMQHSSESKDALMTFVRVALSPLGPATLELLFDCRPGFRPDAVVHVTECWLVDGARFDGVAPSEHRNRREAIMVTVHTHEGSHAGMCPITANDSDRRVAVVEPLLGEFHGRLSLNKLGGEHGPH